MFAHINISEIWLCLYFLSGVCSANYMYKCQIMKNKILHHCILLCAGSLSVLSSSAKIGGISDNMIRWLIDSVDRRFVVIVSRLKNVFWSLNHFTSFTVVCAVRCSYCIRIKKPPHICICYFGFSKRDIISITVHSDTWKMCKYIWLHMLLSIALFIILLPIQISVNSLHP